MTFDSMNNTDNTDFYSFGFADNITDSLEAMNFKTPSPVQAAAIPVIMEHSDLIACAQTGTGKTAAYLLPTINRIQTQPKGGIDTLILVPTRELAIQIDQQAVGFGYYAGVDSTAIYGGSDSGEWARQRTAITEGCDILISTPGRLLQHIQMGYVSFEYLTCLILDEADRMLDMGFLDDIMQIVKLLPAEGRQTLLFSATMPPKIRQLAKNILNNPQEINIAISKPAENIKQSAYVTYEANRTKIIEHILEDRKEKSIIIFSGKKQSVKDVAFTLKRKGYNADLIHSDLEQREREEALLRFRNRNVNILVATDIIARGIDIPDVDVVINFEVPRDAEDYVHRIGRTARAGSNGEAFTLISEKDIYSFMRIEQMIESVVPKLPLPNGMEGPEYKLDPNGKDSRGAGRNKKSRNRGKGNAPKGGKHNNAKAQNHKAKPTDETAPTAPGQPMEPAPDPTQNQTETAPAANNGNKGEQPKRKPHHRHKYHKKPNASGEGMQNGNTDNTAAASVTTE